MPAFVRADGCVQLGPDVTCDGFSPGSAVRIQSHVHLDHMKDFDRSKGHQLFIICTQATHDLLCAEFDADLPQRKRQWMILPPDGTYHTLHNLDVQVALFSSGHMVGSAIGAVRYPCGAHYAFTSDFAWPLRSVPVHPDVLVVDSTYGNPANVRNYDAIDVIRRLQQVVQEEYRKGRVVVTGHRGRLQYALQLMADLFAGPYLVSRHVADTLEEYMGHQGFHVEAYALSTPEAADLMASGRYICLIETRDRTDLLAIEAESKIFLSAFMVPREEPVRTLPNGVIRVALTDHADFDGTIELIKAVRPARLIADNTRGGNGDALAAYVNAELGIPATATIRPTSRAWGMH